MVEESDVVVWLGDLNYRIELPRNLVQTSIKQNILQQVHTNPLHRSPDVVWIDH
jgi:hypothetical protein